MNTDMPLPGTKIIEELEYPVKVVGVPVVIVETVWNDTDKRSFDVYANGRCYTERQSLDEMPEQDNLIELLRDEDTGGE